MYTYTHTHSITILISFICYRCQSPDECVPQYSTSVTRRLPLQSQTISFPIYGKCTTPCNCTNDEAFECGLDGNTYRNACQRNCVEVTVSFSYELYLSIHPSICPSIHPFICPSIHPSICPSLHLSIYSSIHIEVFKWMDKK